jgi:hypothetical protein
MRVRGHFQKWLRGQTQFRQYYKKKKHISIKKLGGHGGEHQTLAQMSKKSK